MMNERRFESPVTGDIFVTLYSQIRIKPIADILLKDISYKRTLTQNISMIKNADNYFLQLIQLAIKSTTPGTISPFLIYSLEE